MDNFCLPGSTKSSRSRSRSRSRHRDADPDPDPNTDPVPIRSGSRSRSRSRGQIESTSVTLGINTDRSLPNTPRHVMRDGPRPNPDLEVPECGAVVLHHVQAEGILAPHYAHRQTHNQPYMIDDRRVHFVIRCLINVSSPINYNLTTSYITCHGQSAGAILF